MDEPQATGAAPRERSAGRRRAFAAATFLLVVALLAGLAGVAYRLLPAGRGDPERFAPVDPAAFHLLVFGGSTAAGEPYDPDVDVGRIVRWRFGGRLRGRPIQVRNFGGPGKTAAETLADVRRAATLGFAPDATLALLYVGNNEFLEFDVEHDLSRARREACDAPTLSPERRAIVLRDYERKLDEMLRILADARIPAIAATIAVNEKDWEPNRSVLRDGRNKTKVLERMSAGDRLREADDPAAALEAYDEVVRLEPSFALARKRRGDCLLRLGRPDAARDEYRRAIDEDGNPYRETSEQRAILRRVCERHDVTVVDAAQILADASPEGLIGFELLWDNCHPTLEGYARIADGFVQVVAERLGERPRSETWDDGELASALGVDDARRRQVFASRGQYCYVASTLTWDPRERLRRAARYLAEAQRLDPSDADVGCSRAVVAALLGDGAEALASWREAYRNSPETARRRAAHPQVRQIMRRCGEPDFERRMAE